MSADCGTSARAQRCQHIVVKGDKNGDGVSTQFQGMAGLLLLAHHACHDLLITLQIFSRYYAGRAHQFRGFQMAPGLSRGP